MSIEINDEIEKIRIHPIKSAFVEKYELNINFSAQKSLKLILTKQDLTALSDVLRYLIGDE